MGRSRVSRVARLLRGQSCFVLRNQMLQNNSRQADELLVSRNRICQSLTELKQRSANDKGPRQLPWVRLADGQTDLNKIFQNFEVWQTR